MSDEPQTYRLQDSMPVFDESSTIGDLQVRRKSILVIEDEEDLNHALACRLRKAGFHVLSAFDAVSGLQETGFHRPDLVLVDLIGPHFNTTGYLAQFLQIKRMRQVPVVVMTDSIDSVSSSEIEQLGIADVLEKPIAHQIVVEHIASVLNVDLN